MLKVQTFWCITRDDSFVGEGNCYYSCIFQVTSDQNAVISDFGLALRCEDGHVPSDTNCQVRFSDFVMIYCPLIIRRVPGRNIEVLGTWSTWRRDRQQCICFSSNRRICGLPGFVGNSVKVSGHRRWAEGATMRRLKIHHQLVFFFSVFGCLSAAICWAIGTKPLCARRSNCGCNTEKTSNIQSCPYWSSGTWGD